MVFERDTLAVQSKKRKSKLVITENLKNLIDWESEEFIWLNSWRIWLVDLHITPETI